MKKSIALVLVLGFILNAYSQSDSFFESKLPVFEQLPLNQYAKTKSTVVLRSVQDMTGTKVATLAKDTEVYISLIGKDIGNNSYWCRVETNNNQCGWIDADNLMLTGRKNYGVKITPKKVVDGGHGIAVSSNNKFVATKMYGYESSSSSADGTIYLYTTGGKLLGKKDIDVERDSSEEIEFSTDNKNLYYPVETQLWQISAFLGVKTKVGGCIPEYGKIVQIVSDKTGKYVIMGYDANGIKSGGLTKYVVAGLYCISSNEYTFLYDNEFMWPNSFAFSPDAKTVAGSATNPGMVQLWDTETKKVLWRTTDISGSLAFSVDGTKLYVVSGERFVTLDPKNGKEKSSCKIYMSNDGYIEDAKIIPEKNLVVMVINGSQKFNGLYFYRLSDGALIDSVGINNLTNYKYGIENIAVTPDASHLYFTINTDRFTDTSATVFCDMAITYPTAIWKPVEIKYTEAQKKARDFILSNSFEYGRWELHFSDDGTYTFDNRYVGSYYGNYDVKKDGSVYMYKVNPNDDEIPEYLSSILTFKSLSPDYTFNDFFTSGALVTDEGKMIHSCTSTPAWGTYNYEGVETVKYPGWGKTDRRYVAPKENVRMRKEPSLDSEVVTLGFYYGGNIPERTCLYKYDYAIVVGKTTRKDKIDGITAPWYLVYEDDCGDGEDVNGEYVWIFGGYVTEFGVNELDTYRKRRNDYLESYLRDNGLYKEYTQENDECE
jgi:WD40 repeat protein